MVVVNEAATLIDVVRENTAVRRELLTEMREAREEREELRVETSELRAENRELRTDNRELRSEAHAWWQTEGAARVVVESAGKESGADEMEDSDGEATADLSEEEESVAPKEKGGCPSERGGAGRSVK